MYVKLFALLLACTTSFAAMAQSAEPIVVHAGKTHNINIAPNLRVMLVQESINNESLSMNSRAQAKLQVRSGASSIYIDAAGSTHELIHLYVTDLQSITLGSNARVQTSGFLLAPQINVYVDENAQAILKTKGKVYGYGVSTVDVNIRRTPVVVPAANTLL